jgi:hypothetical protein
VSILKSNGDGSFQAPQNFSAGSESSYVAVGDFNGDGVPDLIVASGTVRVLLGNGDGTFRVFPASEVSYVGGAPNSMAV